MVDINGRQNIEFGKSTLQSLEEGFDFGNKVRDRDSLAQIARQARGGNWKGAQDKALSFGQLGAGIKMQDLADGREDRARTMRVNARGDDDAIAKDAAGVYDFILADPALKNDRHAKYIAANRDAGRLLELGGVDPADPDAARAFFTKRAQGWQDPLKVAETQSEIGLRNSQSRYYDRDKPGVGADRERMALDGARFDPDFESDPDATHAKWRGKYGIGEDSAPPPSDDPAASRGPDGGWPGQNTPPPQST